MSLRAGRCLEFSEGMIVVVCMPQSKTALSSETRSELRLTPRIVPGAEARGLVAPRRTRKAVSGVTQQEVRQEHTTASLDGITTFPDHGADWSATHVYTLLDVVVNRRL